jgi:hypothetical protein
MAITSRMVDLLVMRKHYPARGSVQTGHRYLVHNEGGSVGSQLREAVGAVEIPKVLK